MKTRRAHATHIRPDGKGNVMLALSHGWFGLHVTMNREQGEHICAKIMAALDAPETWEMEP